MLIYCPERRVVMKKVAVFGNAGGGKSTLSKRLSQITGLPLYVLDKIQYQPDGIEVSQEDYKRTHEKILVNERWIIDGFGCMETLWLTIERGRYSSVCRSTAIFTFLVGD